jgi:glutamate synthase (NADPH/NADH)
LTFVGLRSLTGRNFGAGMSGGIAYVLDLAHDFYPKVNHEMVELGKVTNPKEIAQLRGLIEDHRHFTGSAVADRVLKNFNRMLSYFVRVIPLDYKRVLEEQAAREIEEKARQNVIDLIPSQAQLAAEIASGTSTPKHSEPAVGDVEDSMLDTETAVARGAKLDKVRGFMKYKRMGEAYRPARKRTKDWSEVSSRLKPAELQVQAARCMDCGVPFCQSNSGCPISNLIPSWNELVFRDDWHSAYLRLKATNNMSWATGRVCPAPCQSACVAGINAAPVEIKSIECAIIDRAYEEGWVQPEPPKTRTGKKIAVIGSGPAGLSCAEQLNRAGHLVTVYERSDAIGGLLYCQSESFSVAKSRTNPFYVPDGIPNMKLEKRFVDRHVQMLRDEGITFVTDANVGVNIDINELKENNDAVVLAIGSTVGRDLKLPGRESEGIYQAMDFLTKNTSTIVKNGYTLKEVSTSEYINAAGLDVVVLGGGDTGNDVLGTSVRQGAKSIVNFELLPEPPATRAANNPWPTFARIKRIDYGHAEVIAHWGKDPREYCISTTGFVKDEETGRVKGVQTVKVEWTQKGGQWSMEKVPGSEKVSPSSAAIAFVL